MASTFCTHFSSHNTAEGVYERAKIPRPAHLLVTRIVQFIHRILSGLLQAAQSVLEWIPKLKRSRSDGRQSYKNLLYNITSVKGSKPLTKLTPDSRSQRVGHLPSDLKNKSFGTARIKAIPPQPLHSRTATTGGSIAPPAEEKVKNRRVSSQQQQWTQRIRHQRQQNITSNPIPISAHAWKSRDSI